MRFHAVASVEKDPAAAAVDRRPQHAPAQVGQRAGQSLGHRHADDGLAGADCDSLRQSQRGANAGETAGTHRHRDQVEVERGQVRLLQHIGRHHSQDGGLTAGFIAGACRDQLPIHHHGDGTAAERGIDGEDLHEGGRLRLGAARAGADGRCRPTMSNPCLADRHSRTHASSKSRRGERLNNPSGSP